MSKLAHSSDYHMALIAAQGGINDGNPNHIVAGEILSNFSLTDLERILVFDQIAKMKPQPQSTI